jgi:hypothetical protein
MGNRVSSGTKITKEHLDGVDEGPKMKRCHMWGLLFLVVIVLILFYLLYCKMSQPKTLIGLDLPQLGLPSSMPDIIVFPDLKI